MAEDRNNNDNRNENQGGLSSFLDKAVSAAAAVGASAALLRGAGLDRRLHKAISIGDRFSRRMGRYTSQHDLALRHMTYKDTHRLLNHSKNYYKQAVRDYNRHPNEINIDSNRSGFGMMQSMMQLASDSSAFTHDTYTKKYVLKPVLEEYRETLGKTHDLQSRRKFEGFIQEMSKRIRKDNPGQYEDDLMYTMRKSKYGFDQNPEHEIIARMYAKKIAQRADQNSVKIHNEEVANTGKGEKWMEYETHKLMAKKTRADILDKFTDIDTWREWQRQRNASSTVGKVKGILTADYLEDRQATIKDILEQHEKLTGRKAVKRIHAQGQDTQKEVDFYESLHILSQDIKQRNGEQAHEEWLNMTFDNNLRIDENGDIYSTHSTQRLKDKLESAAASTIPGKILKLRDHQYASMAPHFYHWTAGELNPILAGVVNAADNKKSSELDKDVTYLMGKYYKTDEDNDKLVEIKDMPKMELISGQYGSQQHLIHQMAGDTRRAEATGFISDTFDVWTDRDEYSPWKVKERAASVFTKYDNENYLSNKIKSFVDPSYKQEKDFAAMYADDDKRGMGIYVAKARELLDVMQKNTGVMPSEDVQKLLDYMGNQPEFESARKMLEYLKVTNDEELLKQFQNNNLKITDAYDALSNKSLANYYNQRAQSWQETAERIRQINDNYNGHGGSSLKDFVQTDPENKTLGAADILRQEIGKEAMLRTARGSRSEFEGAAGDSYDYNKIANVLKAAGIKNTDTRFAATSAVLEHGTHLEDHKILDDAKDVMPVDHKAAILHEYFTGKRGQEVSNMIKEDFESLDNISTSPFDTMYENADETGTPMDYAQWISIKKQTGPLDLIASMNSWSKLKSTAKTMYNEATAGRDDMGNVSLTTLSPYFMLSRLSDEANSVGLGFSSRSMGSTYDIAKAIMLKRVLPVAAGLGYYEWADDTAQEATGMSFSGAMAGGMANTDIALRRGMDAIGLTDWLKDEKKYNPIMQYWGDHNDFMDADELADWYKNGYTPYRKGAWWTFGGVNEARGAEIQFWQPNFVRRIQSDYEDKALYKGYFDKWSHSWLPTPTNPLSPLMALLDPYHNEEEHEDDRPYQLTGPLFEEGTPWAAVLNPTIGDIIKPQKEMHPWRNWNGVDPLSLIHSMNMMIRQEAKDLGATDLIQIKGNEYTPVDYTSYTAPTEDESVTSIQTDENGNVVNDSQGTFGVLAKGTGGNIQVIGGEGGGGATKTALGFAAGGAPSGNGGGNAGFTKFSDKLGAQQMEDFLKQDVHHVTLREGLSDFLFGNRPIPQESIAVDSKGKLGVYTNIPVEQKPSSQISLKDELLLDREINGDSGNIKKDLSALVDKFDPRNLIGLLNSTTKARAAQSSDDEGMDESEGFVNGDKLKNYRPDKAMELLNDPDTVTDLINQEKGKGFVDNAAVSWRLITGIYGYGIGAATGIGVDNDKRIATAGDMNSFSRTFWDSNMGGLGGGAMEIARRFIPNYRRSARVNNLMNEMPDWMPERFKYGDPYTQIIKGEMRLPGKGYEALNDLHPDQYGQYGAFDRMKILADIAPFSPEYKMWAQIAKKTIVDPELIDQMQDIKDRRNQQGKKHDFYDYKVIGKGLDYHEVVVSEVLGYGKFRSGDHIFKVAGVSVKGNQNETQTDVLSRYLSPGQTVTVAVDENAMANKDSSESINAAVFSGGENIGKTMMENGDAKTRKGDTSAAATMAQIGPVQRTVAWISEGIAHTDIPWISDQYLRVRSPLESYKAEQVYGVPFQSWDHPISTMLIPPIERAFHDRSVLQSFGTLMIHEIDDLNKEGKISRFDNHMSHVGYYFSNRGAFIGAALATVSGLGNQRLKAAYAGSMVATVGHIITGGHSNLDAAASFAELGYHTARYFEKDTKIGAAIGAVAGVLYHNLKSEPGRDDWVPDRVKKRWNYDDYFDRLTYIKYTGLFQAAAKKAKDEEGVDIDDVLKRKEEKQQIRDEAESKLSKIKQALQLNGKKGEEKSRLMKILNKKLNALQNDATVIEGGEWTRTALLYKQAADATMFALKRGASWSQVITALPTNDREYFMEFVKERDPDKRDEIMRYVSPSLQKALKIAWGQDPGKPKDNEEFFKNKDLPAADWEGWAPQNDLKNTEIKTIAHNGDVNLSDFGFYESSLRDQAVQNAPDIPSRFKSGAGGGSDIRKQLEDELKGKGLDHVDISVKPGPSGGVNTIIADVKHMLGLDFWQDKVNEHMKNASS